MKIGTKVKHLFISSWGIGTVVDIGTDDLPVKIEWSGNRNASWYSLDGRQEKAFGGQVLIEPLSKLHQILS